MRMNEIADTRYYSITVWYKKENGGHMSAKRNMKNAYDLSLAYEIGKDYTVERVVVYTQVGEHKSSNDNVTHSEVPVDQFNR